MVVVLLRFWFIVTDDMQGLMHILLIPSCVSTRGYKICPVCVSVCVCTYNLEWGMTRMISRMSIYDGQGHAG